MEIINYYLVLEKRPGDYGFIDISKLDICNGDAYNDLACIDSFTCLYTEDEIKSSIARSNIVREEYLDGELRIVSNVKHRLNVLTKDIYQIIINRINSDADFHIDLKNRIFGYYKKAIQSIKPEENRLEDLRNALRNGDIDNILKIVNALPYLKSREILLLIYDDEMRRRQEAKRSLKATDDNR